MIRFLDLANDAERMLGVQQVSVSGSESGRWDEAATIANDSLELLVWAFREKGARLPDWMRRTFTVRTEGALTTGTASATYGSDTVTLTGDYAVDLVGRRLCFSDHRQVYTIESGTGHTTSLRIAPPFIGTTNTAGTYTIYEPRLIMPNRTCELPDRLRREDPSQQIQGISPGSEASSFHDPTASGQPVEYTAVEAQDRAFATNTILVASQGDAIGTLGTAGDSTYRYRWFYLTGEEDKLYEITRVDGTTMAFRPNYSGDLAGSATAITVDPAGSPVIQLSYFPTDPEIINVDLWVYLPRYGHVRDMVPIPTEMRRVLQGCMRWLAAQPPYTTTPNQAAIEVLGKRMQADLGTASGAAASPMSPPVVQMGAFRPGGRGWPFPFRADPRIISTA